VECSDDTIDTQDGHLYLVLREDVEAGLTRSDIEDSVCSQHCDVVVQYIAVKYMMSYELSNTNLRRRGTLLCSSLQRLALALSS